MESSRHFPEPCFPGRGDFEYLLGSWVGSVPAQVLAVALCCGAGVRASLTLPEEFMEVPEESIISGAEGFVPHWAAKKAGSECTVVLVL